MKRTPMKRTGWLRAADTTAKKERNRGAALADRAQHAIKSAANLKTSESDGNHGLAHAVIALEATNLIANPSSAAAHPQPKPQAHRNAHLRDMARDMPCLLRVPGVCCHDSATVVCCHSNLSIHGKAGARKADDQYSVWGCAACHRWLDQGPAPREQKVAAFMQAHLRQVLEWRAIAFNSSSAPRDRAAALWALDLLNAQPNHASALDTKARAATNSGVTP